MSESIADEINRLIKATEATQRQKYRIEILKLIDLCERTYATRSEKETAVSAFHTVLRMMDTI